MSYYALVSSLPELNIDSESPISKDIFIQMCINHVNRKELEILQLLINNPTEQYDDCSFLKKWNDLEIQLRNKITIHRAQILGQNSDLFIKPHNNYNGTLDQKILNAFTLSNPLNIEKEIDNIRFKLLEDLVDSDYFSFSKVLAYAIQLTIVLKWNEMNDDIGFNKIEEVILENTESKEIINFTN